jgi:phage gpG-like protein
VVFKIELKGDAALIARIDATPPALRTELTKAVTASVLQLEAYIKNEKLSGQVLHVVSGDLRRSVHAVLPVTQTATGVIGKVAQSGDVKYGAIHEFGGMTKPHDIVATKAKALSFMMNGKQVFFKSVHHPGSKMPERSYMRSSLADLRDVIVARLKAAAVRGVSTIHKD